MPGKISWDRFDGTNSCRVLFHIAFQQNCAPQDWKELGSLESPEADMKQAS